jgi:hypothetical protein
MILNDKARDEALKYVRDNADRVLYCNAEPSSYSNADTLVSNGGVKVGERAVTSSDFSSPTNGDTSGRKITLDKGGFVAEETGNVTHLTIVDDDGTEILQINQMDDGTGGTVSTTKSLAYNQEPADLEILDANYA